MSLSDAKRTSMVSGHCTGAVELRVRMHRDRVDVSKAPIEVRDPDHHLRNVLALDRPVVAPLHERADIAPVFVVGAGRDQLHLADEQLGVADGDRLLEQRRGRDDLSVLLDDAGCLDAHAVVVFDDQLEVERVLGHTSVGDEREERIEIVGARGAHDRAVGKGRVGHQYPAISSCDHAGWRTVPRAPNSLM